MCQHNKPNSRLLRAFIAVTPIDKTAKTTEIVIRLAKHAGFDLEIVGCATLSLFDFPVAGPAIGMPIPSLAVKQSIRRVRVEIQDICNEVISILDKDSSTDIKPKVGYIDGPLNKIVPSLVSAFDVVIIPHRLNLTMKFRICRSSSGYPYYEVKKDSCTVLHGHFNLLENRGSPSNSRGSHYH